VAALAERDVPDDFIPHRGPARLVHTILESPRPDVVVCAGRVPADSAFVSEGRVPAVVLLEMAAQAAAVQQALAATAGGAPARPGYLVGIREASLNADDVAAGVRLTATVRRTGQLGPLATYDVTVNGPDDEPIVSASLSTHAGE
jgi:predicted hotdog family 3-hydroxylacyl-ACP dehydratase